MWPELLVLAGSMLAKNMANSGAQDRQAALQRSMESYQRSKAQQNEQAINSQIAQQTPAARANELGAIQASRGASMQGTVDAARAASPVTQAAGANASPDYQKASSTADQLVEDRAKRAIQQLAVMGATGEQGITSGIRFGRTAGNVDANNAAIGNVGAGYMRDIQNVQPDPFLTMAGDVGMGVGGAMLGKNLGAAAEGSGNPSYDAMMGNAGTFEDSAGNLQSPAFRSRQSRLQTALGAWGK